MKIFNQSKTIELNEVDLNKGYLVDDKLFVRHHNAVEPIAEQGHYEIVKEYPNGGKEVKWVVDKPAVAAQPAYDEYEDIQVYVPYTEQELNARLIVTLKAELEKVKEDIEQEAFGLVRDDFAEKKARAAAIVNKLRVLEGKEQREIR